MLENLPEIRMEGQRVLLTSQLAELYGTDPQIITNNFNRNRVRYTVEKHFYSLEGVEKTAFLNLNQFDLGSLKNAKTIYLWTERGALLHAKSLNTDKAWDVYDWLVDFYFRAKTIGSLPKGRFYYWEGKPIIPDEDFFAITQPSKRIRRMFYRREFFVGGLDYNGISGSTKEEYERKYSRTFEDPQFMLFMYISGVIKALNLLQSDRATREKIAAFFPEPQRSQILKTAFDTRFFNN